MEGSFPEARPGTGSSYWEDTYDYTHGLQGNEALIKTEELDLGELTEPSSP